jgi:glycosyltransferase involved in cell wall biosynthesis
MKRRICLLTPGHLASDPRLVKEADALHEAGFAVNVIAGDTTDEVRPLDAALIKRVPWAIKQVRFNNRLAYLSRRTFQQVERVRFSLGGRGISTATRSHSAITSLLAKAAAEVPADLYIAHCLAALPAAAWAADRNKAKLGFDIEDDHVGELVDEPGNQLELSIRRKIEGYFLPKCQCVTASSPGIAKSYRDRYGISAVTILNVFPLTHAPSCQRLDRRRNELSIYWFSQTIGRGRGLEQLIMALGRTEHKVRLIIRGSDFLGYSKNLEALAAGCGREGLLKILPPAPPDEMAQLASKYDVGLAGELLAPPNRAISLTNKIFIYLLAGIPVLLSDTPAQRDIAAELEEAARIVDLHDPDKVATCLDSWAGDPVSLAYAKKRAWQLGQTRFNWDLEKEKFLRQIEHTLGPAI